MHNQAILSSIELHFSGIKAKTTILLTGNMNDLLCTRGKKKKKDFSFFFM